MIPTKDFVRPYNDYDLTYDFKENRYRLTIDSANNAVGDDEWVEEYGGNETAIALLDHISRIVYNAILGYKDSKYWEKMLYFLNNSETNRYLLIKLLGDVLKYSLIDSGTFVGYAAGVNFAEMKAFDMTIENYIGKMATQIIANSNFANRVILYDLDANSLIFNDMYSLMLYMNEKGYINIDDVYKRFNIYLDGSNFNVDMYKKIAGLIDENKFVGITPYVVDTNNDLLYYIDYNKENDKITFLYENNEYFRLYENGTVETNFDLSITEVYIDFNGDVRYLIPRSTKYTIRNVYTDNTYLLKEYGFWEKALDEKGVYW